MTPIGGPPNKHSAPVNEWRECGEMQGQPSALKPKAWTNRQAVTTEPRRHSRPDNTPTGPLPAKVTSRSTSSALNASTTVYWEALSGPDGCDVGWVCPDCITPEEQHAMARGTNQAPRHAGADTVRAAERHSGAGTARCGHARSGAGQLERRAGTARSKASAGSHQLREQRVVVGVSSLDEHTAVSADRH